MNNAVVTILAIVAALAALLIGLIVWIGGKRASHLQRRFVVLTVCVFLWILSNVAYGLAPPAAKYAIALISYGLAMGLAVQLFIFSMTLARPKQTFRKMVPVLLPGVVAGLAAMAPGVVATGVDGASIATHRLSLVAYGAVLVGYIAVACFALVRRRKYADTLTQYRINLILFGMIVSAVAGSYCNLFLPLQGIYEFTELGPASAALFVGIIAYAIVRHGLFSVKFAAVRTVTYFLALGTMVGLYFGLAAALSFALNGPLGDPTHILLSAGAAVVLAMVFPAVKRFFDRLTNRVFYQNSYDSDTFFARLTRTLTATTELRSLLERAAYEMSGTLNAEQGYFFVYYQNGRHISAGTQGHERLLMHDARALDEYVAANGTGIIVAELLPFRDPIRTIMMRHKTALILPLAHGGGVLGYVCLGERRSGTYVARDIKVLETVADELVIAVQNTLSVQEIREFNETLQQRIDDATQELRASNRQLQKLDEAKDEFVSMASHQLRTPLTSVKGYISMVLEGDAGEITPMQRKLLGEAFTSSERMVHLINDFLNVSRLQTGKFMLDAQATDLAKVVRQEVDALRPVAASRDLRLEYRPPARIPVLYVDEGKIRQVIMNFLDNAIYYSRENTIIKVTLSHHDGDVLLEVHDTGIGVPISEQAHLFTKFFRATNARRQRPDGTGVGLFLAKKVITSHGGRMVFSSVEGEGSVFGFRLPVKKLLEAPARSADELEHQPSGR